MWDYIKNKLGLNILKELEVEIKRPPEKKVKLTKEEEIEILFRKLFKDDFLDEINYDKRYSALMYMGRSQMIKDLIKNRYTKVYKSAVFDRNTNSSEYQKGVFAGRVIEINTLLNEMQTAAQKTKEEYIEDRKRLEARLEHFNIK